MPLFLILFLSFAHAQTEDFTYRNITQDELKMKVYPKDSSAHAVVLNEYGYATIDLKRDNELRLVFNYHVKIKVLDDDGLKQGNIEIPLYIGDEVMEEISDIEGISTYVDESGNVKQQELTPAQIFKIKETLHYTNVKLTMPGLRKGCVFEYRYTINSPYWQNFHSWNFQSDIPKVKSLYETKIPAFWTYNAVKVGALKLDKKETTLINHCLSINGSIADCSHGIYAMNNIPAFEEEDYMTSPRNFRAAIRFELAEGINPWDGVKTRYAKEWSDVDGLLKHADYFGLQIKRKNLLKDQVAPLITGVSDDLTKAKKLYAYIQNTIKWNGGEDFGIESIKKVLEKHSGDCGDVNLTLLEALTSAGINAEPVLTSTRSHGLINKLYPVITEFDYVIVKANIGDKSYLLDATDPLLAFGMLPLRCLNDQGRVMPLDKPSYWIDITSPVIESSTTLLNLTMTTNGKLTGTISIYSKGYAGYMKRHIIKKYNSVDEYVDRLNWHKIKIKKSTVSNIDSLDMPLSEVYEVEVDAYNNTDHDRLSFNPFFFDKVTKNPFKLKERSYPVDWGMPSDEKLIMNIRLPENYTIENPPQNVGFSLPLNGGVFGTSFTENDNAFSMSYITQFKKSIYSSEEYPYLKELFNKIILSEKAEIILKKKS